MLKKHIITLIIFISLSFFMLTTGECLSAANNAVTEQGWDNIGAILTDLNYEFTEIPLSLFSDYNNIKDFDNIFINCAPGCADGDNVTAQAVQNLQDFVNNGGIIYASDWAYIFVERAFPFYIEFSTASTISQTCTANIIDSGLKDFLGSDTLTITYDLSYWVAIASVDTANVRTYVRGSLTDPYPYVNNKPLLVSFPYGKGAVIYTTFHNEAGLSEETEKLLGYLVEMLMHPDLLDELKTHIQQQGYIICQTPTESQLTQGQKTTRFSYTVPNDRAYNLIFGTHWGVPGTFKMTIYSPGGSFYTQAESDTPLFCIEVSNAEPGEWTYEIEAVYVPIDNYPYVTMLGKRPLALNADWLSKLITYPNPFMPSQGHSYIIFDNLPQQCTIKIFTSTGELAQKIEKNDNGGNLFWDVKNQGGHAIASGIYFFIINDNLGNTKKGRLAIIR